MRLRALTAAALLVLGAGLGTAAQQRGAPVAPPAAPRSGFPGVRATLQVVEERELVTRLRLEISVAGAATGQGDTGGSTVAEQLRLVDVTARGFQVRLTDRPAPLVLGGTGRFASGLPYAVPLPADVVVVDCSVEVGAQRRVTLLLQRGDGPALPVVAQGGPVVVRALDDLVRRTCRRPRG